MEVGPWQLMRVVVSRVLDVTSTCDKILFPSEKGPISKTLTTAPRISFGFCDHFDLRENVKGHTKINGRMDHMDQGKLIMRVFIGASFHKSICSRMP